MPSSTSNSKLRSAIRFGGKLVAFGLPFVLTLEVATRLDQYFRYGAPLLGSYTYDAALYERDELGIKGKPYGRFEKWTLNGFGLRGPEIQATKTEGTVRVVSVGASETFGLFETPEHEWPRQLEARLRRGNQDVEVLNASIAGMGLRRRLEFFKNRILVLQPDVALLMLEYSSYVGIVIAEERDSLRRLEGPARAALDFSLSPRIVKKTKDAVIPRLPAPVRKLYQDLLIGFRVSRIRASLGAEFASYRSVREAEIEEYEEDLIGFLELTRGQGIEPVILIPALLINETSLRDFNANFPYLANSWMNEARELFPAIARRIGAEHGARVIDLSMAVTGREEELMMDMFHFNDEGAAIVANAIAQEIQSVVRDINLEAQH